MNEKPYHNEPGYEKVGVRGQVEFCHLMFWYKYCMLSQVIHILYNIEFARFPNLKYWTKMIAVGATTIYSMLMYVALKPF